MLFPANLCLSRSPTVLNARAQVQELLDTVGASNWPFRDKELLDVLAYTLPRVVDREHCERLVDRNLSSEQVRALCTRLNDLWPVIVDAPTGRYSLASQETDRMAALLLAEANNMEARIQQRDAGWAKHHGGTSGERGHWCNFRRISHHGAKVDTIDLPLLFKHALLDDKMKGGLLKFDYVSTSRAPRAAKPIDAVSFLSLVYTCGIKVPDEARAALLRGDYDYFSAQLRELEAEAHRLTPPAGAVQARLARARARGRGGASPTAQRPRRSPERRDSAGAPSTAAAQAGGATAAAPGGRRRARPSAAPPPPAREDDDGAESAASPTRAAAFVKIPRNTWAKIRAAARQQQSAPTANKNAMMLHYFTQKEALRALSHEEERAAKKQTQLEHMRTVAYDFDEKQDEQLDVAAAAPAAAMGLGGAAEAAARKKHDAAHEAAASRPAHTRPRGRPRRARRRARRARRVGRGGAPAAAGHERAAAALGGGRRRARRALLRNVAARETELVAVSANRSVAAIRAAMGGDEEDESAAVRKQKAVHAAAAKLPLMRVRHELRIRVCDAETSASESARVLVLRKRIEAAAATIVVEHHPIGADGDAGADEAHHRSETLMKGTSGGAETTHCTTWHTVPLAVEGLKPVWDVANAARHWCVAMFGPAHGVARGDVLVTHRATLEDDKSALPPARLPGIATVCIAHYYDAYVRRLPVAGFSEAQRAGDDGRRGERGRARGDGRRAGSSPSSACARSASARSGRRAGGSGCRRSTPSPSPSRPSTS